MGFSLFVQPTGQEPKSPPSVTATHRGNCSSKPQVQSEAMSGEVPENKGGKFGVKKIAIK